MSESLPDHYDALSLPRDATSAAIKAAYRKAVLKYHPDKTQGNPVLTEQFHRIQQAYDVLREEELRKEYDADLRVKALREEIRNRSERTGQCGGRVRTDLRDGWSGRFNPNFGFDGKLYTSNMNGGKGPIFEERRPPSGTPRSTHDAERDDYFAPRPTFSRPPPPRGEFDPYDEFEVRKPTVSTPRKSDKGSIRIPKSTPAKSKAKEHQSTKKSRDKGRNADRKAQPRNSYFEDASNSSDDEPASPAARRASYEPLSPLMEERRRRGDAQSDDDSFERSRKLSQQTSDMRDYIKTARGSIDIPGLGRTVSYQDGHVPVVRRSAKGKSEKERDKSSSSKDKARDSHSDREKDKDARRGSADRRSAPPPPPLQTSNSSPNNIRVPRTRTFDQDDRAPPPPPMRRSETMPVRPKRQDSTPVQPSGLRHAETNTGNNAGRDSGYNTGSPSDDPNKRFTEFFPREPGRRTATRSPSPMTRSPYSRGTAVFEDEPPRRPSAQRTDSARTSKEQRIPGFTRGSTMPMPSREASYGYERERERDSRDYDLPRNSPVFPMNTGRGPYDHRREDSYSRRFTEDLRYETYNTSPAGSRRVSTDAGMGSKTRGAQEHMERSRGRGSTPVF